MGMFAAQSHNDLQSTGSSNGSTPRLDKRRKPFGVKQIAMMKSRNDPHLLEKCFEVVCTVRESDGSRVRITLDNGQYFVLKIPQEFDGRFHEITSNDRFNLETKFSYVDSSAAEPVITYESALAKGNAIVLLLCGAQVAARWEVFGGAVGGMEGELDFYLCAGTMTALYVMYLIARSRVGGGDRSGLGGGRF